LRYPKLLVLFIIILISLFFFQQGKASLELQVALKNLGYLGNLIAGFFYAYGFTSAPATAVFLMIAKDQNILLAALVGGAGALLSDILIYLFIKYSFNDEIEGLRKEQLIISSGNLGKKYLGILNKYLLPALAGFIIASPLPTEIGVSIFASLKKMSIKTFIFVAFILHTAGIFVILLIGNYV